jgi:hypothetical protein
MKGRANNDVSVEEWRSATNPFQLSRWTRRVGDRRRYLLLACAIVRHGTGVRTDQGVRILGAIEEHARQLPDQESAGVVQGVLVPRFPALFQTGHPYTTRMGRREVGEDIDWLWRYFHNTHRALTNVLIELALTRARDEARKQVEAEVEAIRHDLIAGMEPPRPGFIRRLLGLPAPAAMARAEELCDAILERLAEPTRSEVRAALPMPKGGEAVRLTTQALVRQRREERAAQARAVLADLVREVFGDPFRPWHVDPRWPEANQAVVRRLAEEIDRTGNVAGLPVLADALEDAGCQDAAVLAHCRGDSRHVPGCWVINAVLGR